MIKVSTVPESLDIFCRGQLKFLSNFYDVVAVSSDGPELDNIRIREGVRTEVVSMERHISIFKDIISLVKMICLFLREKPLIVHSLTPKAGLISMLAAYITGVPIRMHTYTGLIFPSSTGLKKKVLIMAEKVLCFCANYINPEGQGVKRDLLNYKITTKELHVIGNGNVRGIDINYFSCNQDVIINAKKLMRGDSFTFCFVGRVVNDKGVTELIHAFVKLLSENNRIRLFLVGRYEQNLDPLPKEIINTIDHNDHIFLFGQQEDVRPFYVASDVFVLPSYREGFPNVVLEAGAMGIPSVVTDINGSNEIITNNYNGMIVPSHNMMKLYDAMKFCVNNPKEVRRMADNSRPLIIERYEQKALWKKMLSEYEKLTIKI